MKKIYVAGPYTKGDTAINVRTAFEAANSLLEKGFAPFVPHYTHFWHMLFPHDYETWLKLDMQFLACCDALLRLDGDSNGADMEVKFAEEQGIPVFYDAEQLIKSFV